MSKVEIGAAYIVAARRTAIGRVGGLHRNRRVEELAVPVVQSVLADACIAPDQIDGIIIGNATQGGNPARLIALAAGLPERASAQTIDRQCASGLEAILADLQHLCESYAVPALRGIDPQARRVIISLADREVEYGAVTPYARQVFEVCNLDGNSCIWEMF